MVRVKNRYLLVNILYPELEKKATNSKVPDVVALNQPTTDSLTSRVLLNALREGITNLFGDYGSGAVAGSLAGKSVVSQSVDTHAKNFIVKYLSPATSTFILRVSRAHYRLVWATLSLMNNVPVKDGKNCVFRVVRVSGTIRKAEEEAIRTAREMILKARRELGEQSESMLDNLFGKEKDNTAEELMNDIMMVDKSDEDEDEEEHGDGDGWGYH